MVCFLRAPCIREEPHQLGHLVFLLELGAINPDKSFLVSVDRVGEDFYQPAFPCAGGPEQVEVAQRPAGICKPDLLLLIKLHELFQDFVVAEELASSIDLSGQLQLCSLRSLSGGSQFACSPIVSAALFLSRATNRAFEWRSDVQDDVTSKWTQRYRVVPPAPFCEATARLIQRTGNCPASVERENGKGSESIDFSIKASFVTFNARRS